ncbi:Dabb family protein [Asticcacaulis machinosus]|uniref:Dabb family protein n=1 Tax=Asticcacaulis machinosus TaxID=2984211 RepID=A0ABT5HMP2_9CAUL|nr:Dabb family protein [Asticcacaulis machinosus]MDC7677288.1 Dabb family protein [Asticcacaulis machinosus]
MIKHIVMWKLKDDNKAENAAKVKQVLEGLQGKIDGLTLIEVGIDFSATGVSGDIVLYSEFTSREALDAYQVHPAHQEAAAFVRSVVSDRLMVDYEV